MNPTNLSFVNMVLYNCEPYKLVIETKRWVQSKHVPRYTGLTQRMDRPQKCKPFK
jgi:hypothetical protein